MTNSNSSTRREFDEWTSKLYRSKLGRSVPHSKEVSNPADQPVLEETLTPLLKATEPSVLPKLLDRREAAYAERERQREVRRRLQFRHTLFLGYDSSLRAPDEMFRSLSEGQVMKEMNDQPSREYASLIFGINRRNKVKTRNVELDRIRALQRARQGCVSASKGAKKSSNFNMDTQLVKVHAKVENNCIAKSSNQGAPGDYSFIQQAFTEASKYLQTLSIPR